MSVLRIWGFKGALGGSRGLGGLGGLGFSLGVLGGQGFRVSEGFVGFWGLSLQMIRAARNPQQPVAP